MERRSVVVTGLLIVGGLALLAARPLGSGKGRGGKADSAVSGGCDGGPVGATASPPREPVAAASVEPPRTSTVRDREVRDRTRERLIEAFGAAYPSATSAQRSAPVAPPPALPDAPAAASSAPALPRAYIQERMREDYLPMAKQCYENALARDPKVKGKVVMSFRIVAHPSVGGVVEEADLGDETTLKDPDMALCLRESMLSMAFRAPEGQGVVTVKYPLDFSNDDEPASSASAPSPAPSR